MSNDGLQEYEVESITRARVHDKKGKKITWKYYVKWKGYDWDESTWEPTDSFQGGSEHILETFWERVNTGGRDIADATAFKKGEELFISGPPVGKKGLKRKANSGKTQKPSSSVDVPGSNGASISAPPLATRKRRQTQIAGDDECGYTKPKHMVSAGKLKDSGIFRSPKRRRVSSPAARKPTSKRLSSVGDSQLDADGETDPDVVEVEDELMQVSTEDTESLTLAQHPTTTSGGTDEPKKIAFDDLEHFYSGNPIDIEQNADEHAAPQKSTARPRLQSPLGTILSPSDDAARESQVPASPTLSHLDPLFDSPSDKLQEIQKEPALPHHRARAANPRVKLIDMTMPDPMNKQSRITAKARLMTIPPVQMPSSSGPSRNTAKRGGKPGPGRSSSGLITKTRSSLLTATGGGLRTVKGKFTGIECDQPDEIEEAGGTVEGEKLITSWSDEDIGVDKDHQTKPGLPSGDELLKLAGFQTDPETLPDYEEDSLALPREVEEIQGSNSAPAPAEKELFDQPPVEATEERKTSDHVVDASPPVPEVDQQASGDLSAPSVVIAPMEDAVKKSIELAKEHLFPSSQTSFNSFSTTQSSFRSTIFGPLYQGFTASPAPIAKNELGLHPNCWNSLTYCCYRFSTTFKVILGDGVELPLVLKDCSEIKARIGNILIGNSSGSKVAVFYSAENALSMVSTLRSGGTARVVLDPSAQTMQQEHFSTFLRRFESFQTLIAPVGDGVCVLYSSENASIAERLGAPAYLRGLSSTLLISHASIENQLAYVAVIMKAAGV